MKTINDINLYEWFDGRKLSFAPNHFTKTNTPINEESRVWIQEKLQGRYAFYPAATTFYALNPAFEDPKEALFYELTWG